MTKYRRIYAGFLKKFLNPQRKINVVIDCSNGAIGPIAQKVFKNKPLLNFKLINQKADGNFPAHSPNPLEGNALKKLSAAVLRANADIGVVFDADGDRAFFVDHRGKNINTDAIARLLIWHLNPKKAVVDARTGWLVRKGIINNESGIRGKSEKTIIHNSKFIIHESRVGRYFVQKLMKEKNADFGAERSGHYYFKNFYFFDSGILAAIEVINAVSRLPYSLADFTDLLPEYYSAEIDLKINRKNNYSEALKKIQKKYKESASSISRLDGLKMEISAVKANWWFNIHFSNTEPFIRLTIESESPKLLAVEQKNIISLLKRL